MSLNENRMNLGVLQKKDPYIRTIKAQAKHVTLYKFVSSKSEWELTGTEGTCFVYERSVPPYHGFMILNRLGLDDFIEVFTAELEFSLQPPFLLYKNPPDIYGLWFYEAEDCQAMSELFKSLVMMSRDNKRGEQLPSTALSAHSNGSLDILQMLSKAAHSHHQKSEPPNVTNQLKNDVGVKPHALKQEAFKTDSFALDQGQPITLEDLFKKASLISHDSTLHPLNSDGQQTAFKRPLLPPLDKVTTVAELESLQTPEKEEVENNVQLLTPANMFCMSQIPTVTQTHQEVKTPAKSIETGEPITELLSPMAFSESKRTSVRSQLIPVAVNPQPLPSLPESFVTRFHRPSVQRSLSLTADALPLDCMDDFQPISSQQPQNVTPLTKEQFKQAFIYLLNNDTQFLNSIHGAYINSLANALHR